MRTGHTGFGVADFVFIGCSGSDSGCYSDSCSGSYSGCSDSGSCSGFPFLVPPNICTAVVPLL